MKSTVSVDDVKYDKVRNTCKLLFANCTYDATVLGRCEHNGTSGKMSYQCAPVCETCEMVDFATRCPMNSNDDDSNNNDKNSILQPGDLDRTFQDIVANPTFQKRFGLQVLSRPSYAAGDTAATATYQIGPWIVLFDNLLSDDQADRLIEMGARQGFQQSFTDVGKKYQDGTIVPYLFPGRTSTNAWCMDACARDGAVERATAVIADYGRITNICRFCATRKANSTPSTMITLTSKGFANPVSAY
jgi:hypothetical protein